MSEAVIQLKCDCNNYPWGKKGKESLAAQLCSKTPGTDFKLEDEKEYAEMWMGTYPTTPSYVLLTGELLQDVLNKNKEALMGPKVLEKFGADLPFLPKILSIAKPLPLQLHPNRDLASKLHKQDPDKFSDSNHKPEIAVTISEKFEVFAGFKPAEQIQALYQKVLADPIKQENLLAEFQPPTSGRWTNETVRTFSHAILTSSTSTIQSITKILSTASFPDSYKYVSDLLPRIISLSKDLSETSELNDPAVVLSLLTMNFIVLSTGEALYIPADGIHAYVSGDIFECMARSDNVLNVGFCPQVARDKADVFTKTLTFKGTVGKEEVLLDWKDLEGGKTKLYAPPMSEFSLMVTTLANEGDKEKIRAIEGPSIMIVITGEGKMQAGTTTQDLKEGYIFFVGQGVAIEFESGTGGFQAFRAFVE